MTDQRGPSPYAGAAPIARWIKAVVQMIIGGVASAIVLWVAARNLPPGGKPLDYVQEQIFGIIGLALVVAAAVELAYTLFTDGPDEALDPLMLGLSAALLLQLGSADALDWRQHCFTCSP